MASGFGYRTDPFTKARKMHEGMDFAKNRHPNFMQLATVSAQADNRASGYGNHIVIRHGYGYRNVIWTFEQIHAKRAKVKRET
jgi:murein DD-endopeptidase MepM/ murein hydrolase activator NlpD